MEDNSYQNLYDDKIFNVTSLANLKESSIMLLSKNDENIQFEYEDDFWKYENGILIQYPDYVSMRDNSDGKVVFAPHEGIVEDYGASVVNTLQNMRYLKNFKNFSLEDRKEYIKSVENKNDDKILPFSIDKEALKKIEQQSEKMKRAISDAPVLKEKDMDSVRSMVQATVDVFVVLFTFMKAMNVRKSSPKNIVNDVLMKLDTKEIDGNSLLNRDKLVQNNPEMKELFKKYDEFAIGVKNSELYNKDVAQKVVQKALSDEVFLSKMEETANDPQIQKQFAEQLTKIREFFHKVKNELDENLVKTIGNLDDDNKQEFLRNIKQINLPQLFREQGLNPKSYNNQMETFVSSAFLLGVANEDELDYKNLMTKYIGITDKLENKLSFENILNISSKIGNDILHKMNIKVEQTQERGVKKTI